MWEQVTDICQTNPRSPRLVFYCFCSNISVRFCWNYKVWSVLDLQTSRMVKIALYNIDGNGLSSVCIWGREMLSSYFLGRDPVSSALMIESPESFEISAYIYQSKQCHIPQNRSLQRERSANLTTYFWRNADQVQSIYSFTNFFTYCPWCYFFRQAKIR